MSTYWYMACDKHKERADKMIVVTRASGSHLDNEECLLEFLLEHKDCALRFFSEYDDERYAYETARKRGGGE